MVLKLYGYPHSTCTKRVAIILHEKQVPFEFFPVDIPKGEHKTPAFLEKQPFGQVPYIEDDGFELFESRAIGRYLALKYAGQGTPLLPSQSDIEKTAKFEQASSIELAAFEPYASKVGTEKIIRPLKGLPTNEAAAEDALKMLDVKLDVYDKILGKQKYLAGDDLTVVDLFHITWGVLLSLSGSDIMERKPNVKRWWTTLIFRPSFLAVKNGVYTVEAY